MTIEEAIFCEKSYIGETNCIDCKYYGTETCQSRESHRMAVKALKQGAALDKIRAEIIDTGAFEQEIHGKTEFLKGIDYCLDVINKYMEVKK